MKIGISALFVLTLLSCSCANADEETKEQKSKKSVVNVQIKSSSTTDGKGNKKKDVSGKIVVVGPDGVKKEYDINENLPEGFERIFLPGDNHGVSMLFDADESQPERFMVGVGCEPASDVLRQHLHLGEAGLVVTQVSDSMPASKAGIRKGDILLSVGETQLTSLESLVELVTGSEGNDLKFVVLQSGEKKDVIVKPEKSAATAATVVGFPYGLQELIMDGGDIDFDMDEIQKQLGNSSGNFIIRRFGPGIKLPRGTIDLDVEVDSILENAAKNIEIDLAESAEDVLESIDDSDAAEIRKELRAMRKKMKMLEALVESLTESAPDPEE